MHGFIRIKRRTFRIGAIFLFGFFLSLIAYVFAPQIITPKPGEKSLRCEVAQLYVGLARAAGENCTTECTNWEAANCSGFSSCYNKNISCTNGRDQNGRPCLGCCFDCKVECTPIDEPPSISASISCGQWGTNGWCRDSAVLNLSASDPQGYDLSITGNANGSPISCNGNCSIDLSSGSGSASFTATASQSGMSVSGNMGWNYDPESPNLGLNVSGSVGRNGWYTSPVTIASTGSDSISGLVGAFLSVNGGAWQTSDTLDDGQHTIDITASDYAGNVVNSSTTIFVDTTTPSISINVKGESGRQGWFTSGTAISASTSDSTSGIASVEFSVDGGPFQSYSSGISFSKGKHTVRFRATDQAGNSTETSTQEILVDTNSPMVSLDTSNFSDGVISYKSYDGESGVALIYINVEEKSGTFPKVKWNKGVSGKNVTGEYQWNGNLEGEFTAPPGEYIVWIKVVDQAGNEETQADTIIVSDSSTPLSTSVFSTLLDGQFSSDDEAQFEEPNEETIPSSLTFGGTTTETRDVVNQSLTLSTSASSGSSNPFPWWQILGPVTVAAGITTFVVAKTKPKRSAETQAWVRAGILAKKEAEREAEERRNEASKKQMQSLKTQRMEAEEDVEWEKAVIARQKAVEQAQKKAEIQAGLEAYYNARKQGEAAVVIQPNWWEETKSAINDSIIRPFYSQIYWPYVAPLIDNLKEPISNGVAWANENIYKPYIEPEVLKVKESISKGITQINENVFQPYIKPWIETAVSNSITALSQLNAEIIQPYIKPMLETVYEELYQPYIEPILEVSKNVAESIASPINKYIYQPFIQPVVNHFYENIYAPFLKPVVDDVNALKKNIWDKYGEWVHGSLDAAGFIPGLGEIADGLNGLIYLGEGRYIEASVSLLAMIPVLGDLGKAGKWGLKVGIELVEEAGEKFVKEVLEEGLEKVAKGTTEEVVEKVAKVTTEGVIDKAAKETAGEVLETVAKETTGEVVEKTAKETTSEVAEKTAQNAVENISSKTLVESAENATENAIQKTADNILEKAAKDTGETITSASTEKAAKEAKEKLVQQALEKVDDKTAALVRSVSEKVGDDVVSINKAIALVQKYGDDAVQALKAVDADAASKVLRTVDDNILDDVVQQGSDAFAAFSGWTEKELKDHGKDLATRAAKDAEVLNDVKTLVSKGPIDPKNLTKEQKLLIEKIAANSTFIADGKQIVVGKWVGLDGGFLKQARETGSLHYSPHPDLWGLFKGLENQNEAAWLINQEVIQTGIGKGLPFEYTLDGIPAKDIVNERAAIKAIFSGQTEEIIKRKLKSDYLPVRLRELQELKTAGFELTFDEMNNSYILIKQ